MYSSFKDMSVPFPRTSGARFCGNDTLCVFACPMYMKRLSTCGESVTPRSLSALDVYLVNYAHGSLKRPLIGSGSVSRPLIGCGSVSSRPLIGSDSVPRPLIGSGSTNNDTEHNGVLSQRGERGTTRAAASPGGSLPSPTAGVRQKASVMTESVGSRTSASSRHQQLLTLVLCYDSSRLTLLDRQLAMDYRLFNGQRDRVQPSVNSTDGKSTDDERFAAVCRHNAGCAAAAGRRDLERMWHVLAVCVALMSGGDDGDSWQTSVAAYSTCTQPRTVQMFARRLIANLLDHYMRLRDIQTVAVVLCMLVGWSCRVTARHHTPPHTSSGGATSRRDGEAGSGGGLAQPGDGNLGESPYRTVQTVDSCRYPSLQQAVFYGRAGSAGGASVARQSRSNSWTDEASCAAAAAAASVATNGGMLVATVSGDAASGGDRQACTASPQHLLSLVDGSRLAEFSSHVHTYAEVLYNWRMLIERADVMKHVASFRSAASGGATSSGGGGQYGMEVRSRCGRCWLTFVGTECPVCHRCTSKCALCQTPVKGMSAFCLVCGHGGHLAHVRDWFSRRRTCPAGCSCKCQHVFQQTFESV